MENKIRIESVLTGFDKIRLSTSLGEAHALRFKHWLKHGPTNVALDKVPPFWEIMYLKKNLEPIAISEVHTITVGKRQSPIQPDLTIFNQRHDRDFLWASRAFRYGPPLKEKIVGMIVNIRKKTRI